ncbi:hypothetical protein [Actinomadura sp. KC345]|nr:hypothetical protein [Actinomadura sp. KC345]
MYTLRKMLANWLYALIRLIDPSRTLIVNGPPFARRAVRFSSPLGTQGLT